MITFNDLDDNLKAMIGTHSAIVNHADGEDLTVRKQVLKFADRHKPTTANVARGYIIVRRKYKKVIRENVEVEINILTQDTMTEDSTIYVINYEFDLNGETIEVPNNSVLLFNGGKLINGTVNLNGAQLIGVSLYPQDYIETIGSGIKAGTPRWTSNGYIEWWDGSKWFNPYTTLNDALNTNLNNIAEQFTTLNNNLVQAINTINSTAQAETEARTTKDTELEESINKEIEDRTVADTNLQKLIDNLSIRHENHIIAVKQLIQANTDLIGTTKEELLAEINKVVEAYKKDDYELRELIVEYLKKEANARAKDIGTVKEELRDYIDKGDKALNLLLRGVSKDTNAALKRIDDIADEVHKHLVECNALTQQLNISVIDMQNRLDRANNRIKELEDNASKYLVRFRMPDGTILGGQYVEPNGTPIVPDLIEGATFDKDFSVVTEDMLINVTV